MTTIANVTFSILANAQPDIRLDRVESLLQLVRDYNDDFMAVIIWSLSVVFGLTIVLIGFNWFQSNRALKNELDSLSKQIRSDIEAARSELSNSLKEQILKEVKASSGQTHQAIVNLDWRIKKLEYLEIKLETEHWLRMNVAANAVYYSAKLLEKSLQIGGQHLFEEAISNLEKSLKMLEKTTTKIDLPRLSEVEAILKNLDKNHTTTQASLLEKLKKAQYVG